MSIGVPLANGCPGRWGWPSVSDARPMPPVVTNELVPLICLKPPVTYTQLASTAMERAYARGAAYFGPDSDACQPATGTPVTGSSSASPAVLAVPFTLVKL